MYIYCKQTASAQNRRGKSAAWIKKYLPRLFHQQHMAACFSCSPPVNMPLTATPLCECMCGAEEVTRSSTSFLPNTLSSLLEPCLAVILKKVNLEQMVVAAHGFNLFFFPCFSLFLWYFSSIFFVWERSDSSFSVAWITSIKETVGRDKRNIQLILHCVMNKI